MEIAELFLKNIGILELMIKSEESNNLLMVKVLFLILRVHFMKVMLKILRDSKKPLSLRQMNSKNECS